ncbi:hypothetical protein Lbys_0905 [Leadbetterella byssophila DSM 17132]|uniref:Uncharacterized protein n=1 Tax=Leadbetterella byssophila (strain DSM 17132 / JCM 16389 / KACC 11308 / NBRC 106382 / 4M15) TaxID=649349 RepID=E4RR53_LEAB4|nr:hypothetical protein Lbys_0905 [Leadbetterella byssophila DSM 17132]
MRKFKLTSLLILLVLFSFEGYSQSTLGSNVSQTVYKSGIGLGSVIAVVTSWDRNKSIFWAIFHGICSWLYVVYYAFSR